MKKWIQPADRFIVPTDLAANYSDQEFSTTVLSNIALSDNTPTYPEDQHHLYSITFWAHDNSIQLPSLTIPCQLQYWCLGANRPTDETFGGCCFYAPMGIDNTGDNWIECQFDDAFILNCFRDLNGVAFACACDIRVCQAIYDLVGKNIEVKWTYHPSDQPTIDVTWL